MMTDHPKLAAAARKVADQVSGDRLWTRLMTMAEIGTTPKGGVNREAFSVEDNQARGLLANWARDRGFEIHQDCIGNIFIRRPGTDNDLPPILAGSHLDSQPTGGRFDGVYGVLAAFEALEAMEDAGIRTTRPIEAVAWMNEEGSRFQTVCMGSGVYTGHMSLDEAKALVDPNGIRLADVLPASLEAVGPYLPRPFGSTIAGYIECHIEQGPILDAEGIPVGVVAGIQGIRWFRVTVRGFEAHAGTTPLRLRQDAGRTAMRMVDALERALVGENDDITRFTVGSFQVHPGSPNVIPGTVTFTVDLRHPDPVVLHDLGDRIDGICQTMADPCDCTVSEIGAIPPVSFPAWTTGIVRDCAGALGLSFKEMTSGAGHDASHIGTVCPSAMIFIPCYAGISHNESESARSNDCRDGALVLAASLARMDETLAASGVRPA